MIKEKLHKCGSIHLAQLIPFFEFSTIRRNHTVQKKKSKEIIAAFYEQKVLPMKII